MLRLKKIKLPLKGELDPRIKEGTEYLAVSDKGVEKEKHKAQETVNTNLEDIQTQLKKIDRRLNKLEKEHF